MADDIKIKLGLDATDLFAGLNKATAEAQKAISTIGNTKVDINEAPLVADLNKVETEAKQTGDALNKGLGGGLDGLKDKFGGLSSGSLDLGGSLQSLTGGVTSLVPGLGSLSGVLAGGGITAGIAAIGGGIAFAIEKGKAFETQLASLSSITGVSGPALDDLGEKAKVMASKFGTEATANIESFKTILSKLGPDIAKSPEALNSMAESVNTLSKATGDDPGKATEALTGALLQFGVSLEDPVKAADAMAVAMNVLAAGAKEGASEVPDVAAAINVAGVAASSAKVSFEETNSAIQILAAGGKVGAEAGTSLRNVLNKLGEGRFLPKDTAKELAAAGVDINKLGDTTISFSERLRELNKISGDAALKTKLFGTDAAAASILINGANGSMDDLTKKLTGTNTAYDQAAINMATFDETLNRIKSNVDNFAISFYDGMMSTFGMMGEILGPSIGEALDSVGQAFANIWAIIEPILMAIGGAIFAGIVVTLNAAMVVIDVVADIFNSAFDAIKNALQPVIDQIKAAFGMDGAMGEGQDTVKIFSDVLSVVTEVLSEVGGVISEVGGLLISLLITPFELLFAAIAKAIEIFRGWISSNNESTESMKKSGEEAKKKTGIMDTLRNAFDNIRGTLGGLKEAFNTVKDVIKNFFDALSDFDLQKAINAFSGFGEKLTQSYNKGFNETKKNIEDTREAARKAEEFAKYQKSQEEAAKKGKGTGAGAGDKGGGGVTQTKSDFDKALAAYKEYLNQIELNRKEAIADFERQGLNKEEIQFKLASDPKLAPTADAIEKEIMDRFKATRDDDGNLQIGLTFGKGEDKDKALTEVRKLLLDAGKLEIDFKLKTPDFKEELKGFETAVKDIEKNVDALIPKTLATSQEALDANTSQVTKYLDFIKSQNAEIEQAKTEALASGNIEAAESFDAQINRNVLSINTLTSRLATYQTDSKKAIDKAAEDSTLTFQLTTALQTNILDAFNSERIAKEREANEALRAEKLGALDAEEKDLTTSLAKREVSFEEYAAKMADIDAARQQAMEDTEVTFMERLKEVQDKTVASLLRSQSAAISGFVTDQFKDAEGNVTEKGKIIGESMTALTEQFASLAESGKATLGDFGNAAAAVAFDAVSKMIPSFVAGILGSSITALGPIAGPIAAGLLTASLQLLIGQAKAALGFKDGVIDLAGPGTETSDSIPAWLSRGESVITAASTKANKEELAWMNANPGMSIKDYFATQAPAIRYSVTEDGDLIKEVRKLREETRGLGRQINRNTHVSISGELRADNNSIKAVIESERRRNARRG